MCYALATPARCLHRKGNIRECTEGTFSRASQESRVRMATSELPGDQNRSEWVSKSGFYVTVNYLFCSFKIINTSNTSVLLRKYCRFAAWLWTITCPRGRITLYTWRSKFFCISQTTLKQAIKSSALQNRSTISSSNYLNNI